MKRFLILFMLFIFSVIFSMNAKTEDTFQTARFTVKPVLPKNQQSTTKSFFNLNIKKEKNQTVYVTLKNLENKKIRVNIKPTNALTSPTGEIEYIPNDGNEDSYLIDKSFELMNAISVQPYVDIPPKKNINVPIVITIPEEEKGTYLGGLLFEPEGSSTDDLVNEKEGIVVHVESQVAFAIAIQLNFPKQEKGKVSLLDTGMKFIPSGVQAYVEMQNDSASIIKDVSGVFKITKENGEHLFTKKIQSVNLSPKAKIRYPIFWESGEISPGQYKMNLEAEVNGEKINELKDLNVENNFIKKYAEETGIKTNEYWFNKWWIWVLAVSIIFVVIFIVLFIGRKEEER